MSSVEKRGNGSGVLMPPAVGYAFGVLIKLFRENRISPKYYPRMAAIGLVNLIDKPFRAYEQYFINPGFKKVNLEAPPVFILGHWRSGTTYLHNLLCSSPLTAYVNTFQSVFPDTLFSPAGRFIFKNFMGLLIPKTRKGDNVKLNPDYPQEEEFALGANSSLSYYNFWMFPDKTLEFYDRYIEFKGLPAGEVEQWKDDYKLLINKAVKNTGGKYFISKNPPNTARIKILLDMYPGAKFIHIYRNPVNVFLSTRHFFRTMLPNLCLHDIDDEKLTGLIFTVYKRMMKAYFEDKRLIPPGNLTEVAFEELEREPLQTVERIFSDLGLEEFESSKRYISDYVESKKGYKKNVHRINKELLDRILEEWAFTMDKWGYDIPGNIITGADK